MEGVMLTTILGTRANMTKSVAWWLYQGLEVQGIQPLLALIKTSIGTLLQCLITQIRKVTHQKKLYAE